MDFRCCFNCKKRHPLCHADCEEYLAAKADREERRKKTFEEKGKQAIADTYDIEREYRKKRYYGRR